MKTIQITTLILATLLVPINNIHKNTHEAFL